MWHCSHWNGVCWACGNVSVQGFWSPPLAMMADFQGLFQLSRLARNTFNHTSHLQAMQLCKTYEAKQQRKLNKNQCLNMYKLWATDDLNFWFLHALVRKKTISFCERPILPAFTCILVSVLWSNYGRTKLWRKTENCLS